ncbi:MAG: M24 family metallopeptidase [Acholeplasmataceae bacterium]|jgi:Xaa-Pro aminopeptidase|nr:M24 family metallopeptidase [Acholeplasmataceae bacterium]
MYKKRRQKLISSLAEQSIALFYSGKAPKKSADQSYPYEVNRNFYYLTGINQSDSYLMIVKGINKQKTILFLEPYDRLKALWVGKVLDFEDAKLTSGIDDVMANTTISSVISQYLGTARAAHFGPIETLYLDLERRSMAEATLESQNIANKLTKLYPHLVVKNTHPLLSVMRSIKDETEIKLIQEAIEITNEGIIALLKNTKPGLKEYQIEAHYNFVLNMKGVTPSFKTIAGSGINGTVLHYEENNRVVEDGELILFDLGVQNEFYCSDITRTFPVNGKFSQRQKEIYEVVLNCNKKVIEFLKPGVTNQEFNDYAKKLLAEGLIKLGKIETEAELSNYYYHSIGHFLGLDVHDVGDYTLPFEAGQILTVEPGLYLADEKIGIRIEDNILITETGSINLSANIVKEISELEALMEKK